MKLVDRYLNFVSVLLPRKGREDIVAELRDSVLSRVEEREAALGRPLTDAETEELLQAVGHPVYVAGSYHSHQPLIGPALQPFYELALRIMLVIVLIVHAVEVAGAVMLGRDVSQAFAQAFAQGFHTAVFWVGLLTIGAVLLERAPRPAREKVTAWRARDLPVFQPPRPKSRSLFEALFEIAFLIAFIAWWANLGGVPDISTVWPGVSLAPVWDQAYAPILVSTAVALGGAVVSLAPGMARVRGVTEIACGGIGIYIVSLLHGAGPLLLSTDPQMAASLLVASKWIVIGLAIGNVVAIVQGLWRLVRGQ